MSLTAESKSSGDYGFLEGAWLVVALLWPVALLNYLDRQMLASMKFSVMSDIPSIGSNENWGYMLGQFKWVYAFLSPLGGLIADRIGRKVTICGSLFAWSLVTWWTSRATSYDELLMTRSLMGISEAFYIPAALALIADYHLGATRSRAVGLHQIAIYCGVIMGGFGGYVADEPQLGWRFAFFACGIAGMIYTLPLLWCLRDVATSSDVAVSGAKSFWGSITTFFARLRELRLNFIGLLVVDLFSLLTNISFILLILYFTLPALAGWVVRDWMPAILKEQFSIGQGKAGVAATLYWQLAAIVGALVGGWLADRWMQRNIRGRIYISAIGMALIVPAIFGVGNASSLTMAITFLILFGLGWGFFDGN
ncbi:MAG: D-galactonate transporter, partial [Planctomycetota bacterium]